MADMNGFTAAMQAGYGATTGQLVLGAPLFKGECAPGVQVKIPLPTMNRHGLICGATGTGKTKTLQVIAEQLSLNGVPSLLMDIKGDLSGLAAAGVANEKVTARTRAWACPTNRSPCR